MKTLVGSHKPGESDNPPHFYEPGGLSVAGSNLYVADTNNHKIRVVDLKTNAVKTLAMAGLSPPRQAARPPSFARAKVINVPAVEARPGKRSRSRSRSRCRRATSSTKRRRWHTSSRRRTRRASSRPTSPRREKGSSRRSSHLRSRYHWPSRLPPGTRSTFGSHSRRSSAARLRAFARSGASSGMSRSRFAAQGGSEAVRLTTEMK